MVVLFGAAPDTGNQGVTALCQSAVDGLAHRGIGPITVADHGRGLRNDVWTLGGHDRAVRRVGLTHNRRIWRGDCLRTVRVLSRLGGVGNPVAAAVAQADAVLDVSGGDSFTDLYGAKRFRAMCMTKRLALEAGRPLILLPQTLGPFRSSSVRAEAAAILRAAAAVWVRDAASFDLLREILGDAFDPARHRAGLDMALLLPRQETAVPETVQTWLAERDTRPVAGLNVSGLLCRDGAAARAQFGLKSNHCETVETVARAILDAPCDFRLLLVPHVLVAPTAPESDWVVARELEQRLAAEFPERVTTLPQGYTASELKGVISQLSWFAGARMHATIAAFSSGVPTLGLGYSDKAAGVFDSCGLGTHVADLRRLDADDVGAAVEASVRTRDLQTAQLARSMGGILGRAQSQMDDIAAAVRGGIRTLAA